MRAAASRDAGAARWGPSPRREGTRRAHTALAQGGRDNDVCTDLGDNNQFYNELSWAARDSNDCETCYGPGGEEQHCETRFAFPTPVATDTAARTECLSGQGDFEGVTDFCGPGGAKTTCRRADEDA